MMERTLPRATAPGRTWILVAIVVALAGLVVLPTGAFAGVPTIANSPAHVGTGPLQFAPPSPHITTPKSSAYDWPELHQDPLLHGYASNSPLSSLTASTLGVGWATNLYGAVLDSPVVAYDPTLGETLAYIGTESGNVLAINVANGQIVWGVWLGSPIRSSPLENNGSLYIGTDTTETFYKLNATTGSVDCTLLAPDPLEATPTIGTPSGGVTTVYLGSLDEGNSAAPFLAINAGNCSLEWKFSGYPSQAGSWNSASYVVSKEGVPMVLFGTDNPDSSVYALNARNGTLIWRFQCYNPPGADFDVAAGAAISLPGKNGFAQGVVYVTNKADRAYALDLNNGTLIWETNFDTLGGNTSGVARSTPALDGTNVIFGYQNGMFDLNYSTGAQIWRYQDPTHTESIASPAIAGGHGNGIVITGDIGGDVDVVSVVGGTQLYTYAVGGFIVGGPAVSDGNILVAAGNGFLYDFVVGGGDHTVLPGTAVTTPSQGSSLVNPNGNEAVSGTATDPTALAAVDVAIQSDGTGGPWWDSATGTWSQGPVDNRATLASPGAASSSWTFAFPVAAAGGTFEVFANAVSSSGQTDIVGAQSSFSIRYSTSGPRLTASETFVPPGTSLEVSGSGFAASEKVSVSLHGRVLATITARSNGSLASTTVTLPAATAFGYTSLVALGLTSGRTSSAPIRVGNSWEQANYGPGHDGYEPNDKSLNYIINVGQSDWVELAWHFDPGVAINASPAVVDGIAYVGDVAGNVYALDTYNGGLLWNYTLASGAAIEGSPAVDVSRGLVFVSASDGTLTAIHLSTGTRAWSKSIGGIVSAPTFYSGKVYVTSTSGLAADLDESNGTVVWSVSLASSVTAPASLNNSVRLLVVGESNGDVLGLNSSTGATLWSYATGGAITAAATDSGGTVYVGSNNHDVYALNQLTGVLLWKYATAGAVQDTGVLSSQHTPGDVLELLIGSDNGRLYALQASNGVLLFTDPIGSSPVLGIGAVNGIAIMESSNGLITAARTYENDTVWSYHTADGLATAPVIVDGTIYVSAADGNLYAFTLDGHPPM
jgi:outer membrane protein assembly factor BamB